MPSKHLTTKIAHNSPLQLSLTKLKQLKLRTKATVVAIAISALPVVGMGLIIDRIVSTTVKNRISTQQQATVEDLAQEVNRFMVGRYENIQVLAKQPIFTAPNLRTITSSEQKQAALDRFIDIFQIYDSIAVFDLDGNVIAQSQGNPLGNHSDRDYFQQVKKTDKPYISQPISSKSSGLLSIYTVAPVKDENTGETIAIIRSRIPVNNLQNAVKDLTKNKGEYYLLDDAGKIVLPVTQNDRGIDITQQFPGIEQLIGAKQPQTKVTSNQKHLISYVTSDFSGLSNGQWQIVLAQDTATAFAQQRQLLPIIVIGTAATALIVGLLAAWLSRQATEPIIKAAKAVKRIGQGDLNTRLPVETADEIAILNANINRMADQLQNLLQERALDTEIAQIFTNITTNTRKGFKTEEIFETSVREIRQALKTDRVVVYQFNPNTWDGEVVAESVNNDFPPMMGVKFDDPCFREDHIETYKNRRVRAIANIHEDPDLTNAECYIQMLESFAVKANLIAPILVHNELTGLIIAHNCQTPRTWEKWEIDLFSQLAMQIGYALEQAQLLEEIEKARQEEQEQKEQLQVQLLALLSDVEGAASGDLRVRAEVTPGEIGTVADFFNSIVENLRLIVTQVKDAANQVNNSLEVNEAAIRDLAQEALDQAGEINNILDAVDGMTHSMKSLATNAREAATVANNASHTAKNSGQAMEMTVQNIMSLRETVGSTAKKVKRLGESTQQISRVVSLINEIAMQTHLLAINAGIEAARAGEEGQGFAVVAEEVSALATRCAGATKEIEHIVENIQRETSDVVQAMELGVAQVVEGTNIVEDAKGSLNQILEVSRHIDSLVQSISDATASQVQTAQTISQLMQEIAAVSQRTSNSSHQVSASLQKTVEIAQQLQATVGTFQVN